MHQLAIALKNKGYQVTGSDDEIYDPSRSLLAQNGLLPSEMGWSSQRVHEGLDAVILGMHAKPDNVELEKARELKIPVFSFPEYFFEQSKEKQRTVIAGSHGKTTITAAIMHVLKKANTDFDYLVGAKLNQFEHSVRLSDAPLIVMEGDEYLASPIHRVPKIHYYMPHLTLLSGIAWDHFNVFPSFDDYARQFTIFLDKMPKNAMVIYNAEDEQVVNVVKEFKHLFCFPYTTPKFEVEDGVYTWLTPYGTSVPLKVFGQHNLQNLNGARMICNALGIEDEAFFEAIQSFEGAAKRLDLLYETKGFSVFRDFAHAPSKVEATTKAVKSLFPERNLTACFELHTFSSLNKDFLPQYQNTLNSADRAVVFFNEHTLKMKGLPMLSKEEVKTAFQRADLEVLTEKEAMEDLIKKTEQKNNTLLLMSSGTFNGIANEDIVNFVG